MIDPHMERQRARDNREHRRVSAHPHRQRHKRNRTKPKVISRSPHKLTGFTG